MKYPLLIIIFEIYVNQNYGFKILFYLNLIVNYVFRSRFPSYFFHSPLIILSIIFMRNERPAPYKNIDFEFGTVTYKIYTVIYY